MTESLLYLGISDNFTIQDTIGRYKCYIENTRRTTEAYKATEIEVNAQTEIALVNYDTTAIKAKNKKTHHHKARFIATINNILS